MYSVHDTPKGWVAPFGHPGIKACSRLPRDFRSVPRPSSPPGAKASTRCPSHTQTINPPCTGTIHAPNSTGRIRTPNPTASHTHHSAHISNAPEHCSHTNNRHHIPSSQRTCSTPGQTPMPAQATDTHNTTPKPTRTTCAGGQRPPEVSCASRDAPEPDSQSTKNKHAHPVPRQDDIQATPSTPALCRGTDSRPDLLKPLNPKGAAHNLLCND